MYIYKPIAVAQDVSKLKITIYSKSPSCTCPRVPFPCSEKRHIDGRCEIEVGGETLFGTSLSIELDTGELSMPGHFFEDGVTTIHLGDSPPKYALIDHAGNEIASIDYLDPPPAASVPKIIDQIFDGFCLKFEVRNQMICGWSRSRLDFKAFDYDSSFDDAKRRVVVYERPRP